MNKPEQIQAELLMMDVLLQDIAFAETMAAKLDIAGTPEMDKITPAMLVEKSVMEEKIAINLAGFYALEAGIDYYCNKNKTSLADCLNRIINQQLTDDDSNLFNRFANATWKAGQPFRGLTSICRYNFTGFSRLSAEEVQKDYRQIMAAARFVKNALHMHPPQEQFKRFYYFLQDKNVAVQLAAFMAAAYYTGEHKSVPEFLIHNKPGVLQQQNAKDQKTAVSLTSFYAMECFINLLVTRQKKTVASILKLIINGELLMEDQQLLYRFAHACFKAGKAFYNIGNSTADCFMPFELLSETQIEKYRVQIYIAAALLYDKLCNKALD